MHRSASTCRVSDEFFVSPQSKSSPGRKSVDIDHLPTYDPLSDIAKKETSRLKSAENAVHIIPIVLILCAIILWFFSNPADVVNKGDSIVARIEGLKIINGSNNQTGSIDDYNNQTALLPDSDMDNLDIERIEDDIAERAFKNKSE